LEEPLELVVGDDGSAVGYREDRVRAGGFGGDLSEPARVVVADGVVDEVGGERFDEPRIAGGRCWCESFDESDVMCACLIAARSDNRSGDVRQVEGVPVGDAALTGGQRQEGLDESFLVLAERESFMTR
jgi:hypothetical protein